MDLWVCLFWICNGVLFMAYLAYPLIATAIVSLKGSRPAYAGLQDSGLPVVAFIVPAFNEETVIDDKIRNTLELDYPYGRLRVIVVTDGSDDATSVLTASHPEVLHLHGSLRRGKPHAMNRGAQAGGDAELLVFSDANTQLAPYALRSLVAPFVDPRVGAVCGEKRVQGREEAAASGEGVYWGYESRLKSLDSAIGSVVGPVGELLAIRAGLWRELPEDTVLDDLQIGLQICMEGSRVAYAGDAVAVEPVSRSLSDEWERKVRIAAGAFQSLGRFRRLLNPFRHGVVSLQFWLRKVIRWVLCPPALLLVLPASYFAFAGGGEPRWLFLAAFAGWSLFAILALAGPIFRRILPGELRMLQYPFYFCFMHAATVAGLMRHLHGRQSVLWRKADR
jgi:cellulose synthase/poly-beta-1,6-N-acetylglucosamine synthase-like glycosyltransferase